MLQRDDTQLYRGLPTIADYDFLLGSLAGAADGWFSLVKGHAQRPPKSALAADGTLNLAEVYDAVGQGYSLLLTKLHKRDRAVGELCRKIEAEFSKRGILLIRPVGANAYLTPRSAQGFATHYDDHDVLVLQLAGHKVWRLYRRAVDSPSEPPVRPLTAAESGKPVQEFTLSPGDLIYMPRGFAHEASTADDVSLHLTLSLYPATWRDIFADVLIADARFRRNLPPGFAAGGRLDASAKRKLRAMGDLLAASPAMPSAFAQVANRLLSESALPSQNGLQQIMDPAPITGASRVKLADGVRSTVEVNDGSAILHLPGASMKADRSLEFAFRRIARGVAFKVRDLPVYADEFEQA